jgi:rhomboid family GlyGly-CTERM serine protease
MIPKKRPAKARTGASMGREILRALQWDRGRWIWLLLIVALLDALSVLGDGATLGLQYDRAAIAAGGWWRLLTAHVVHLDLHHLLLNELGLVLIWALFADDYDAVDWLIIVLSAALAISSGLWWLSPTVSWYVGASGVLHAIMAAGVARHLASRVWDRWILFAAGVFKLGLEQYQHHSGFGAALVVVDAHIYGATAGFLVGAALCWRLAIIDRRMAS